jgi:hypothetical protein
MDHHHTTLQLSGNELRGQLPNNLSQSFPYLSVLNLGSNPVSGTIPADLANMRNLSELNLEYTSLSGRIPVGPVPALAGLPARNPHYNQKFEPSSQPSEACGR